MKKKEMISVLLISLIVFFLVIILTSNHQRITLDNQTYVKWDELNHKLTVYISLSNTSKKDISFNALLHILKQDIVNITEYNLIKLEKDYMNRKPPFIISPYKDQVFELSFFKVNKINKEDLENGFELIIVTDKEVLKLPIKKIIIE